MGLSRYGTSGGSSRTGNYEGRKPMTSADLKKMPAGTPTPAKGSSGFEADKRKAASKAMEGRTAGRFRATLDKLSAARESAKQKYVQTGDDKELRKTDKKIDRVKGAYAKHVDRARNEELGKGEGKDPAPKNLQTGARGGRYYISSSGEKTYVKD